MNEQDKALKMIKDQARQLIELEQEQNSERELFINWLDLPVGSVVEFCTLEGVWHYGKVTRLARFYSGGLAINIDGQIRYSEQLWYFPQKFGGHRYIDFPEWCHLSGGKERGLYDAYVARVREIPPVRLI